MKQNLFARFAPTIRDLEICDLDDRLLLDRDGPVSVYYAPFDYIDGDAKIVIAGITPGKTQMLNALREARKQLRSRVLALANRTTKNEKFCSAPETAQQGRQSQPGNN